MKCNDVVDLIQASKDSNWRREKFLDKIFTAGEQFQIQHSINKDYLVWLFWSMKESAYKISVRQSSERFFAPQKFQCRLLYNRSGIYYGEVLYDNISYYTNSEVFSNSIFTIADTKDELDCKQIIYEKIRFPNTDYKTQHDMIYSEIIKKSASINNQPEELFSIKKDEFDIPHLYFKNTLMPALVSISHHGNIGAYVIQQ